MPGEKLNQQLQQNIANREKKQEQIVFHSCEARNKACPYCCLCVYDVC